MNFVKNNWKKLIIVLVLIAGLFFYRQAKAKEATQAEKYPSLLEIDTKTEKTIEPKLRDINETITTAGKIQAERYARLGFQAGGQITWVGVKIGDKVKKGQALVSVDRATLQKQLKRELNDYSTNRSTFEDTQDKYRQTKENSSLTTEMKRILERTQWSLENSVIDVELAALAMRYSSLVSPIDGIVVELTQPQAGVFVGLGNVVTVVDPESLYFRSEVDEEDVVKIYSGQPSIVTLDAFSDQNLNSKISYIAFDSLESKAATVYEIRFDLPVDNGLLKYRLGMNGNADIITKSKSQVMSLPINAVYEDNGQHFVYKAPPTGDKKIKVNVKTGLESTDYIEITEGVVLGDKIVTPNQD